MANSRVGAGFVNAKYFSPTQGFSVGSVCSTAPDLARWVEALASGRVVSAESYRQMTTPSPAILPDGERLTHGFGTGVGENEGHRVFYHDGGIFGFDTIEAYYPQDDLTIIVLCNTDGDLAAEIENAVARQALGIAPPADRLLPAGLGASCLGAYRIGGSTIQVRDRDGRLSVEMPGEKPQPLLYREGSPSRWEPARPSSASSSPAASRPSSASRNTVTPASSRSGRVSRRRSMVDVVEARHLRNYTVWLKFEDGAEGEVDLSEELHGPVFEPLRDPEYFRSFTVSPDFGTISWPNGADFAPEFLYDKLHATA